MEVAYKVTSECAPAADAGIAWDEPALGIRWPVAPGAALVSGKAEQPRRVLIRFVADRPGHDRRYAIDPSKAERELDWRPREGFESGLARTVEWYLANEWWWRPHPEGRYAGERLGLPVAGKGTL